MELLLFTYKRFICCVNGLWSVSVYPRAGDSQPVDKFTRIFNPRCLAVFSMLLFFFPVRSLNTELLHSPLFLCLYYYSLQHSTCSPFRLSPLHFVKPLDVGRKERGIEMNKLAKESVME